MPINTNMPWAVYKCDKIGTCEVPKNETFVSGHLSSSVAMTEANRMARIDRKHSYTVGLAS